VRKRERERKSERESEREREREKGRKRERERERRGLEARQNAIHVDSRIYHDGAYTCVDRVMEHISAALYA